MYQAYVGVMFERAVQASESASRVGPVVVLIAILAVAAGFVVFGIVRSIREFGFGNGRVFTRPAAPWTLIGLAIVVLDAVALILWIGSLP